MCKKTFSLKLIAGEEVDEEEVDEEDSEEGDVEEVSSSLNLAFWFKD